MPNERDLRLEGYSIGRNMYRELKYYCRQYREKKLFAVLGVEQARRDAELIERAAGETCGDLAPFILQAVTTGKSYDIMRAYGIPACRNVFTENRRRFFYRLAVLKGIIQDEFECSEKRGF